APPVRAHRDQLGRKRRIVLDLYLPVAALFVTFPSDLGRGEIFAGALAGARVQSQLDIAERIIERASCTPDLGKLRPPLKYDKDLSLAADHHLACCVDPGADAVADREIADVLVFYRVEQAVLAALLQHVKIPLGLLRRSELLNVEREVCRADTRVDTAAIRDDRARKPLALSIASDSEK